MSCYKNALLVWLLLNLLYYFYIMKNYIKYSDHSGLKMVVPTAIILTKHKRHVVSNHPPLASLFNSLLRFAQLK